MDQDKLTEALGLMHRIQAIEAFLNSYNVSKQRNDTGDLKHQTTGMLSNMVATLNYYTDNATLVPHHVHLDEECQQFIIDSFVEELKDLQLKFKNL